MQQRFQAREQFLIEQELSKMRDTTTKKKKQKLTWEELDYLWRHHGVGISDIQNIPGYEDFEVTEVIEQSHLSDELMIVEEEPSNAQGDSDSLSDHDDFWPSHQTRSQLYNEIEEEKVAPINHMPILPYANIPLNRTSGQPLGSQSDDFKVIQTNPIAAADLKEQQYYQSAYDQNSRQWGQATDSATLSKKKSSQLLSSDSAKETKHYKNPFN